MTVSTEQVMKNMYKQHNVDKPEIRILDQQKDKDQCYKLRYNYCISELKRDQYWMDKNKMQVRDPMDDSATLLGAMVDGKVVGTCRLNFSDTSHLEYGELYDFEAFENWYPKQVVFASQLIIAPEYRRQGLFSEMLKAAYMIMLEKGSRVVVLDSSAAMAPLFQRYGFIEYKSHIEHPDNGFINILYLDLQNESWLKESLSPLLETYQEWQLHRPHVDPYASYIMT